jgi:hypothetical protein
MIFSLIITLFQNNMLICSSDLKFSKLGMGNSYVCGEGGLDHRAYDSSVEQWFYYDGRRKT